MEPCHTVQLVASTLFQTQDPKLWHPRRGKGAQIIMISPSFLSSWFLSSHIISRPVLSYPAAEETFFLPSLILSPSLTCIDSSTSSSREILSGSLQEFATGWGALTRNLPCAFLESNAHWKFLTFLLTDILRSPRDRTSCTETWVSWLFLHFAICPSVGQWTRGAMSYGRCLSSLTPSPLRPDVLL